MAFLTMKKELGQLFCDNGAEDIVKMLGTECDKYGVSIQLRSEVSDVEAVENNPKVRFKLKVNAVDWQCQNLIIATGGSPCLALGASPLAIKLQNSLD